MTDSPNLTILDIGHGNCAVLSDSRGIIVFDGGPGGTLMEFLRREEIHEVEAILISHADDDHIAGACTLLLDKKVRVLHLYVNPDADKRTQSWQQLRIAAQYARQHKETEIHTQLTTEDSECIGGELVRIEVVAPTPEMAMSGPGGVDLKGKGLSSNGMSAVVRLVTNGGPVVLLPGDIENLGIQHILDEGYDITAKVLVFPHHGGKPHSSDVRQFVKRLCELVRPECVVFSIGRGKHGTPRPELVETVLDTLPGVRIACTQMSEHCTKDLPTEVPEHLLDIPAAGRPKNACCCGSLRVDLSGTEPKMLPDSEEHAKFVIGIAPSGLCLKRGSN